jgi:hypothetical protein
VIVLPLYGILHGRGHYKEVPEPGGTGMKVFVDEGSRAGVACSWNRSESSHVLAQLCDDVHWFYWVCCRCQELAGDSQCFSVLELS